MEREAEEEGMGGGGGGGGVQWAVLKATTCVFYSIVTQINNGGILKLPSQGMSVYPPKTYGPFLMIVMVCLFPSHLL